MTPIGYASYLAFYPPRIDFEVPYKSSEQTRRYNYKPWSGARPEPDLDKYSAETKKQFAKTKSAFDKTQDMYDGAVKAADAAATSYDKLAMDGF